MGNHALRERTVRSGAERPRRPGHVGEHAQVPRRAVVVVMPRCGRMGTEVESEQPPESTLLLLHGEKPRGKRPGPRVDDPEDEGPRSATTLVRASQHFPMFRVLVVLFWAGPGLMCSGIFLLIKPRPTSSDQALHPVLMVFVGSMITIGYVVAWSVRGRRRSRSRDQRLAADPLLPPPG